MTDRGVLPAFDYPMPRLAGLRRALGALIVALLVGLPARDAAASSYEAQPRISGRVLVDDRLLERWCVSGAWLYPVGDPIRFGILGRDGVPAFRINRGVEPRGPDTSGHDGVDLCNRRRGDLVRAAALGLVVHAGPRRGDGYGTHVVLAHRLDDGDLAYSVYAHLAPKSVRVREGEMVSAGTILGRVGRSGRASTDHLHFEIRLAVTPEQPWQKSRAIDPISFISARLPSEHDGTPLATECLEWAECSALIPHDAPVEERLTRARWWTMLARAAMSGDPTPPTDRDALRERLIDAGVVAADRPAANDAVIEWSEMIADASSLARVGLRVPRCADCARTVSASMRAASVCGPPVPAGIAATPSDGHGPTIADACAVLANLSDGLRAAGGRDRGRLGAR